MEGTRVRVLAKKSPGKEGEKKLEKDLGREGTTAHRRGQPKEKKTTSAHLIKGIVEHRHPA